MDTIVETYDLGIKPYRQAWLAQQKLHHALVEEKRAMKRGDQQDPYHNNYLLLVEHPHVYTLGKNGLHENLRADEETLTHIDAEFVETDRGGDITYHGPGQIVGYPILDLDRFSLDVKSYIQLLEEMIIRTCAEYGVEAHRKKKFPGVWVGNDKICAIGVKTSRGITMHGFAFNIFTDLHYFEYIVPCGITDKGVTNLSREVDDDVYLDNDYIKSTLLNQMEDLLGIKVQRYGSLNLTGLEME